MLLPYLNKDVIEAGCDEAGRGCLAGPVCAAAVILPKGYENAVLNDSKKLTAKQRSNLRQTIEQEALAWAVAFVDNNEIDEINILNASFNEFASISFDIEKCISIGDGFKSYSTSLQLSYFEAIHIYLLTTIPSFLNFNL